jgi:hypothetical protein
MMKHGAKIPKYRLNSRLGEPQSKFGQPEEEEYLFPLTGIEL